MLKGTLDDFTLPDIFLLLSQSRKTGRLDVQRSAGQGNVYFRDGDVYFAESTLSKELIGQKLVKAKVLTDGQLMKALDEQAEGGGRLGDVLRGAGLVDDQQLEGAVRSQIQDAVFDLLRWDAGEFDWAPGEAVEAEVPLSVSVENLIMEGSRRLDELAIITRKIPSENAVVEMAPAPPEGAAEINITPDEWRILVMVNGQRSVLEIAESVGADIFATMRTLYGLAAAGLVHVPGHVDEDDSPLPPLPSQETAEATPVIEPEPEPAAIVEEPVESAPIFGMTEDTAVESEDSTGVSADTSFEDVDLGAIAEITDEATETPDYHASAYDPGMEPDLPAESMSDTFAAEILAPESEQNDPENDPGLNEPEHSLEATDLPTSDWFDAPQPGDLIEETPTVDAQEEPAVAQQDAEEVDVDPFVSEILGPETTGDATPVAEDLKPSTPTVNGDASASGGYRGSGEVVDKRNAVQELSDLFKQSEVENTPTFLVPAAPQPEEPEQEVIAAPEPESKHRVEDDEEITRGLISRLIDGVKGL